MKWCRRRFEPLGKLSIPIFVSGVATFVCPAVWAYFAQKRFGWGPGMVGVSLAIYGTGIAIVQGLLIRPVLRWIGA